MNCFTVAGPCPTWWLFANTKSFKILSVLTIWLGTSSQFLKLTLRPTISLPQVFVSVSMSFLWLRGWCGRHRSDAFRECGESEKRSPAKCDSGCDAVAAADPEDQLSHSFQSTSSRCRRALRTPRKTASLSDLTTHAHPGPHLPCPGLLVRWILPLEPPAVG